MVPFINEVANNIKAKKETAPLFMSKSKQELSIIGYSEEDVLHIE